LNYWLRPLASGVELIAAGKGSRVESFFGVLMLIALNVAPWFIALNKSLRRALSKTTRWAQTEEDRQTYETVIFAMGIVLGLCFNILCLGMLAAHLLGA
jgi:hypothetical protein